jgi:hypothetical protein
MLHKKATWLEGFDDPFCWETSQFGFKRTAGNGNEGTA